MSVEEQKKKLLKAMGEDDRKQLDNAMLTLRSFSEIPIHVRVHSPSTPDKFIEVRGRPLKDREITAYMRRLEEINPALLTSDNPDSVPLKPEELEELHNLFDEYIALATQLPLDFLQELGDNRIRYQLFKGIMVASNPSKEDVEATNKFPANKRGLP